MPKFIDLTGKTFGDWTIEEYIGNSNWKCINLITHQEKIIHSYDLRTKYLNGKMEYKPKEHEDIKGQIFNYWEVIEHISGSRWRCKCLLCGNEGTVAITDLKDGSSKMCNNPIHKNKEDLTGKTLGKWKVLYYAGDMRW